MIPFLRITTTKGHKWLAHKGKGYSGGSQDTVLTDARHMSSKWKPAGDKVHVKGKQTVGDFMEAAAATGEYKWYNWKKNCWGAADAIIKRGEEGN